MISINPFKRSEKATEKAAGAEISTRGNPNQYAVVTDLQGGLKPPTVIGPFADEVLAADYVRTLTGKSMTWTVEVTPPPVAPPPPEQVIPPEGTIP